MNDIFDQLPNWSRTVDSEYQPDYTHLKAIALEFIELSHTGFKLTEPSLADLKDADIPSSILSKLATLDKSRTYSEEELLSILETKIGKEKTTLHKALILKYTEAGRVKVKEYSNKHCFPKFSLARASALYLFLRVIFDLPSIYPRNNIQVFGGWFHPSIPAAGEKPALDFNLAWPIEIDLTRQVLIIHSFSGYFGKGYDAIGEYDYFVERFPLRSKDQLEGLTFQGQGTSS